MDGWIDPEVLEWEGGLVGSTSCDPVIKTRAYEHWRHADRLLGLDDDPFHRSDLIGSLKRTIDHRLSQLDKLYKWGQIELPSMPRGKRRLEQLEYLGVAKRSMVKHIIDIRDNIEHKDAKPPTRKRCAEMVEFVWYFLRSTDNLVCRVGTDVSFEQRHGRLSRWLQIDIGPEKKWRINIRACVPKEMYSAIAIADWIQVRSKSFLTAEQTIKTEVSQWEAENRFHDPSDIFFDGTMLGPDAQRLQLIQHYLSLA